MSGVHETSTPIGWLDASFGAFEESLNGDSKGELHRLRLVGPAYDKLELHQVVYRHPGGGIVGLAQGPDGYLYFSTADGIYRLVAGG